MSVAEGAVGAAGMVLALVTPMLRRYRSHWGLDPTDAAATWPGDELVPDARWQWTHGIEIDAPPDEVWPWVAQIGQEKAGFYSYEALENLVGCEVRGASEVRPEWTELKLGDALRLHPKMPPLRVEALEPGRFFAVHSGSKAEGVEVSWLFLVEPRPDARSRLVSRFRSWYADGLGSRLGSGPTLLEPIGFVMDRRMLLGVKRQAERARQRAHGER
jgi:hypothetical protein